MFDYATQFLRLKLFTIQGMQLPPPYGGSGRQVAIDLDPFKLASKQLSPQDVVNAILASNVILPAGISRMGGHEYDVSINGSPVDYAAFNRVPIKVVNGATVYVGDVAHAHDGYGNLFNTVHVNGRRAVYLAILKKSNASTLAIVDATRDMLPSLKAAAPEGPRAEAGFRPIHLRARGHQRRVARIPDFSRAGGVDGVRLSGQLAQRDHRLHVHPPRGVVQRDRAIAIRDDLESDDPRRPRALDRHVGRRRDGRGGEHPTATGCTKSD